MKSTDYGQKNPLRCPDCDNYRYLEFKGVRFPNESKVIGMKIPVFKCINCNTSVPVVLFPKLIIDNVEEVEKYYNDIAELQFKDLKEGEMVALKSAVEDKTFQQFNTVGFKYDSRDYYHIPGLFREWNEGFLTPVFFNKELLLYYNSHSDFKVKFASTSRFHIITNSGDSIIRQGFGINRKGKIICWLGDLEEGLRGDENEFHRKLFLAFNIGSDHDIVSDYYFNQIEANFTSSDNETGIFNCRNQFDQEILDSLGYEMTQLDIENLIDEYRHPVINELGQIENSYVKLNSLLIESLNVRELKKALIEFGVEPDTIKGLKGLKLFEKFIEYVMKIENASEIVSPLFVLYDLRLLAGHIKDSNYDTNYKSCKDRLQLEKGATDLDVHQHLCRNLIEMYKKLKIK
jgi:hypothetical protein